MAYKDTPDDAEDVNQTADLEFEEIENLDKTLEYDEHDPAFAELTELEQLAAKKAQAKVQLSTRFSLKARRAIEDHLEQRRLRKELDYLFDDGFSEDEPDKKTS